MKPSKIAISIVSLIALSTTAFAQGSITTPQIPFNFSGLKYAYSLFSDPWVMLFMLFALGWSLFYMMFRIGLEKSGQVPQQYSHKLATILAFMCVTPMLYYYQKNPDARTVLKAMMSGWPGFMITLFGAIMIGALTYWFLTGIVGWARRTP